MHVGPTLAMGMQGWDKLTGGGHAGFPSHRPGKQDENAAKPPEDQDIHTHKDTHRDKNKRRGVTFTA